MRLLELTLPSLAENLALDEALLLEAEDGRGGEILRLWEWPALGVVLGAAGILHEDVDEDQCRRDGVPISRRASGGGTVLLGPGCLLYSLVLAYQRAEELTQISSSYCYIFGRMLKALAQKVGANLSGAACRSGLPAATTSVPSEMSDPASGIEPAGTSDLALAGRKFSGNSQQRKRTHLLHHGTLLYDFDLAPVGRYLKMPSRQPDYRAARDHSAFLTNLPLARETIEECLRDIWPTETMTEWPEARVRQLLDEKYSQESWIRRR